jgi:hypothetical protein
VKLFKTWAGEEKHGRERIQATSWCLWMGTEFKEQQQAHLNILATPQQTVVTKVGNVLK